MVEYRTPSKIRCVRFDYDPDPERSAWVGSLFLESRNPSRTDEKSGIRQEEQKTVENSPEATALDGRIAFPWLRPTPPAYQAST